MAANAAMEILLRKYNKLFFRNENFRLRVISAVVLAPVILGAMYLGGVVFAALVTIVFALGLREWLRLIDPKLPKPLTLFSYASMLTAMVVGYALSTSLALMIAAILSLILFVMSARYDRKNAFWITIGIPYMAGSGLAML